MKYITANNPPELPFPKFKCPKCGAKIYIDEIDEWETATGIIMTAHINCITEPPIGSRRWEDWFNWHWDMPYVDWMPLEIDVIEWLKNNYRIDEQRYQAQKLADTIQSKDIGDHTWRGQ